MQTKLKVTMVLLCGFVLLAVAACGASDERARISELETELEAEQEARDEAEQRADDAEEDADEAEQRADDAEEDADEAEQRADDAEEDAGEAERERQRLEQERDEAQQQLTDAQQAEFRARASSFGAQLNEPEMAPATVSWPRGRSLTFKPAGSTTPGSAPPSVPGSWRSASFTGLTGTAATLTDETVYLYTNIQAPSSRAFWKVHNVEVANAQAGADDPTPTGAARVVRVGSTLDYDEVASYDIAVTGTYDGVSGTYTCSDCEIVDGGDDVSGITAADFDADDWVVLAAGVRSFVTGTWGFKPGSITSRVKAEDQADQDDAYLYFGIWSSIPDSISGTTYNFRYVAGGGAESGTDLTNFSQLVGPATFRGGAVGKYVTQGQVGGQNAKIGTFTATATLNADFGDGDTPGTLSGSITEFHEDGSRLVGWQVTLGSEANVGVASAIASAAATGSTVANIGGLSVGGSWGANFYGSDNQVLTDRDKYPATQYPPVDLAGVTGWFDATGTSASLAGAFAATPTPGN